MCLLVNALNVQQHLLLNAAPSPCSTSSAAASWHTYTTARCHHAAAAAAACATGMRHTQTHALCGGCLSLTPIHTDMDGFKLLEVVGLELGLPVISEYCSRVNSQHCLVASSRCEVLYRTSTFLTTPNKQQQYAKRHKSQPSQGCPTSSSLTNVPCSCHCCCWPRLLALQ